MPPSRYRAWVRARAQQRPATAAEPPGDAYSISETKIRRLQRAHLAFIRHVGPYEAVPDTLFDSLDDWATEQGFVGPRIWMGIGHDAPGTTRPEHLRFDAALVVPSAFTPEGDIGHQVFEGGEFAVTTHAGPLVTLPAAYAAIFPRVTQLPKHQLIGLPAVEIYQTARVNARLQLSVTDICLPVVGSRQNDARSVKPRAGGHARERPRIMRTNPAREPELTAAPAYATRCRHASRPVRHPCPTRDRRHGGGVSGPGSSP
jgi:DNA gyrase inhibitor GyrI